MPEKYTKWDPVEHLESPEDVFMYLEACAELDLGQGRLIHAALEDIARSAGMRRLTAETGLTFEELHQAVDVAGYSLAAVQQLTARLGAKTHIA